ncbi:uncharacterized protein N7473_003897 [Penicillium subrubescens]|uniref:Uncharacterized protein n=1 Tax=Penicillium subrubescens TaxID=1316194 RepID=A0A1Q5UBK7_9EURO|nr:uncharacterized protein N7473_003897 [Penicillium subrubescens]KAJ5906981.1 hypothetical protein N7473_003897 [Penicillium subrubescens]OKP09864.1 hypothetical protein PENSUB_4788 [Penicillium subrubescens]
MDASSLPEFKILSHPTKWDGIDYDQQQQQQSSTTDDDITLNATSSWTYCGPLLPLNAKNLPSSFHTWAQATVNGSIVDPLFSFLEFVHEFLAANDISTYWLTIRASQGSDEFDVPRWHTDDLFFSPGASNTPESQSKSISKSKSQNRRSLLPSFTNATKFHKRTTSHLSHFRKPSKDYNSSTSVNTETTNEKQPTPTPPSVQITSSTPNPTNWKLTTTLLGPGTLFIAPHLNAQARALQRTTKMTIRSANPDHICLSIRCVGCASAAESVRATLAAALGGYRNQCNGDGDGTGHCGDGDLDGKGIIQAQQGECVFFRVGEDEGAVHSEPMSHGDRVFVNVVPGCEEDLRCLMAKWGMEYPRAWCVGLPFQGVEGGCWRNVGEV